jgi:hypothetical protein
LLLTLALGVIGYRYRKLWIKRKAMAHRSVESASLKQVREDSSDSEPGSPSKQTLHSGKWWRRLRKAVPFLPARNRHRRLQPEPEQETLPEVLQSPSGAYPAKVSQSPLKKTALAFTPLCLHCGTPFDECDVFCSSCGQRRQEEPARKGVVDLEDTSSDGDSTRPPTAASQSTMASAMSALRGLAQHVEAAPAPTAAHLSPSIGHDTVSPKGPVTWSPVTDFQAPDSHHAQGAIRPPAWPPPERTPDVSASDGILRAAVGSRDPPPPPRRRVVLQPTLVPQVPPPRLRRDHEEDDTSVGNGDHPG